MPAVVVLVEELPWWLLGAALLGAALGGFVTWLLMR